MTATIETAERGALWRELHGLESSFPRLIGSSHGAPERWDVYACCTTAGVYGMSYAERWYDGLYVSRRPVYDAVRLTPGQVVWDEDERRRAYEDRRRVYALRRILYADERHIAKQ